MAEFCEHLGMEGHHRVSCGMPLTDGRCKEHGSDVDHPPTREALYARIRKRDQRIRDLLKREHEAMEVLRYFVGVAEEDGNPFAERAVDWLADYKHGATDG